MKKSILALGLAFAALTLPSCSQNEELDVTEVVKPSFELFANIDTRTVNNGLSTAWAEGDKLNVFHAVADEAELQTVKLLLRVPTTLLPRPRRLTVCSRVALLASLLLRLTTGSLSILTTAI